MLQQYCKVPAIEPSILSAIRSDKKIYWLEYHNISKKKYDGLKTLLVIAKGVSSPKIKNTTVVKSKSSFRDYLKTTEPFPPSNQNQ